MYLSTQRINLKIRVNFTRTPSNKKFITFTQYYIICGTNYEDTLLFLQANRATNIKMRATTRTHLTIIIILMLCLTACGQQPVRNPEPTSQAKLISHVLGDTQTSEIDMMLMVYVPAGNFIMGSDLDQVHIARQLCRDYKGEIAIGACQVRAFADEMPNHPVVLDAFWIDRYEVTNQQYKLCVDAGSCSPPVKTSSYTRDEYFGSDEYSSYPVIWITQNQASEYCHWAGRRLPTEAEWEYAARGPENRLFPWGNDFDPKRLNYCDANCATGIDDPAYSDGYPETAPVGSFPNGVSWSGALDLAGNVREWVADGFHYYPTEPQLNPFYSPEGANRIPRGGGWLDTPDDVRSANRGENTPDYTRHKVGFRCAFSDDIDT